MVVDRDGGRSPGELRGEEAVGRVETPLAPARASFQLKIYD